MIQYIKLREHSNLVKQAAEWFHLKWNIPLNAYLDSMEDCLSGNGAVPQWYLAMDSDKIAGGLGVIVTLAIVLISFAYFGKWSTLGDFLAVLIVSWC
ncbi:hypothetical protein [uncultured Ligilactobacillus sp.]|uniref:hypothetical protein n=1 Tax=uncultured Ligilactobacillus sp. TaxID=2837633 RepID=UPI00272A5C22|nr:hypothetical protein [uncultured Ligilactobacillus sp.]